MRRRITSIPLWSGMAGALVWAGFAWGGGDASTMLAPPAISASTTATAPAALTEDLPPDVILSLAKDVDSGSVVALMEFQTDQRRSTSPEHGPDASRRMQASTIWVDSGGESTITAHIEGTFKLLRAYNLDPPAGGHILQEIAGDTAHGLSRELRRVEPLIFDGRERGEVTAARNVLVIGKPKTPLIDMSFLGPFSAGQIETLRSFIPLLLKGNGLRGLEPENARALLNAENANAVYVGYELLYTIHELSAEEFFAAWQRVPVSCCTHHLSGDLVNLSKANPKFAKGMVAGLGKFLRSAPAERLAPLVRELRENMEEKEPGTMTVVEQDADGLRRALAVDPPQATASPTWQPIRQDLERLRRALDSTTGTK